MKNTPSGAHAAAAPFEIVYRDSALIVVNKPAGVLVIPSPKGETDTLGVVLNEWLTETGSPVGALPCHRIDRETSGLMVYAFGKSFRQKVMDSFEKRIVNKTYLALANGRVGADQGSIRSPIEGQEAISDWKVLGRSGEFTVVMIQPRTGRTNQIRIHFARIGHPLLGDTKFGVRKDFLREFKRSALHAWRLELPHPADGRTMRFEAPLPTDMAELVREAGIASN